MIESTKQEHKKRRKEGEIRTEINLSRLNLTKIKCKEKQGSLTNQQHHNTKAGGKHADNRCEN